MRLCLLLLLPHAFAIPTTPYHLGFSHGKLYKPLMTYGVMRYPEPAKHQGMLGEDLRKYVDSCLDKAIQTWAPVVPMQFERVHDGTADIQISFFSGDHSDGYPFDGHHQGGINIQSHAYFPSHQLCGHIHLDDDEPWEKMRLDVAIAHHLGNVFGIKNQRQEGLMYLAYSYLYRDGRELELSEHDIYLAKTLYAEESANAKGAN